MPYIPKRAETEVDWIGYDGRGFYERQDTHAKIMRQMLMYGSKDGDHKDLPHGNLLGYPRNPMHSFDKRHINVGTKKLEEEL